MLTRSLRTVRRSTSALTLVLMSSLGGCALFPAPAPQVDSLFGTSVRHSMRAQSANPDAGKRPAEPAQFDAQSAVAALAKHRESFKTPPPTFNVIGITSGSQ